MELWIELAALAVALFAIWYSILESRRNNAVLLKIRDCRTTGSESTTENGGELFHEFSLIIQNCGIPLHHVGACIGFAGPEGGRCSLPLRRRKRSGDRDEFAKGMIVEFGLKSYELDMGHIHFLSLLTDLKRQDARINIYSQDYLAKTFLIVGFGDTIKTRWNRLALRFNLFFSRKIGVSQEGHDIVRDRKMLPQFPVLAWPLSNFCRAVSKREEKRMAS